MRGYLGGGIGKRPQRGLASRHARIMQDEAVGSAIASPLAMVGRGREASNERAVRGRTSCHVLRPAARRAQASSARARASATAREAWIDQYQARQTRWP